MKRKVEKENWQENMIKMRSEINEDLKKVKDELGEIRSCVPSDERRVMKDEDEFKNWRRK